MHSIVCRSGFFPKNTDAKSSMKLTLHQTLQQSEADRTIADDDDRFYRRVFHRWLRRERINRVCFCLVDHRQHTVPKYVANTDSGVPCSFFRNTRQRSSPAFHRRHCAKVDNLVRIHSQMHKAVCGTASFLRLTTRLEILDHQYVVRSRSRSAHSVSSEKHRWGRPTEAAAAHHHAASLVLRAA